MAGFRISGARIGGLLAASLVFAAVLGGCSADVAMFRKDWNWWSNSRPVPVRAAAPAALVGPDGACPAAAGEAPTGIALGMTECDLVRVAGPTDQVAISADATGDRVAVLTYPAGERAGIYRFSSGLLVSIERVPEPEKPQRRQQRKPAPRS